MIPIQDKYIASNELASQPLGLSCASGYGCGHCLYGYACLTKLLLNDQRHLTQHKRSIKGGLERLG